MVIKPFGKLYMTLRWNYCMHIWPFCPTHIEALGKAHTSLGVVAFSCILAPLCYLRFLLLSLKRNHFPVLEHGRQVSSQLTKPFWLLGEYCNFSFRSVHSAAAEKKQVLQVTHEP